MPAKPKGTAIALLSTLMLGMGMVAGSPKAGWGQTPQVIAEWNFEDATKRGDFSVATFFYTADDGILQNRDIAPLRVVGPTSLAWNNGTGGSGTYAINATNWRDGAGLYHWYITFSSIGFQEITVSSAQRTSPNEGPRDFHLEYSLNGVTWSYLHEFSVGTGTDWATGTIENIMLPENASNNSEVYVRWLQSSNFSVTGLTISLPSGTNRIDDIIIRGVPMPYIVNVTPVVGVEVDCGTDMENARAQLPLTTTITDSEGTAHIVNLTWGNPAGYDSYTPASYNVNATFQLPAGVVQSDPETPLEVSSSITVREGTIEPVFDSFGPYCQHDSHTALPETSQNRISGSWSPQEVDTSIPGPRNHTFTPDPGQCAVPVTIPIVVDESLISTFEDIGPYCQNDATADLPDISQNGISGSWSPQEVDTSIPGPRNHTFTPDPGQCAVPVTIPIVVDESLVPTFADIGPYCQYDYPTALPVTSQNGISGSWDPPTVSTSILGPSDYIFTPGPGQCATSETVTVMVNPSPERYVVTGGGEYCSGEFFDVGLENSQQGVTYRLYRNREDTGRWLEGNGNPLQFSNLQTAGEYVVLASMNGCEAYMEGSAIIQIVAMPHQYQLYGGGSFCDGEEGVSVILAHSEFVVQYQLWLDGAPIDGMVMDGWNAPLDFGKQTEPGTYTVYATRRGSEVSCDRLMNGDVTVSVHPLPDVFCDGMDRDVCVDDEPLVLVGALPQGGLYVGDGVEQGVFFPDRAGAGNHPIIYHYTDAFGCSNRCEFVIRVNQVPDISCPEDIRVCFDTPPFDIADTFANGVDPAGGEFSGMDVADGWFDPAAAGVGMHSITYTYRDASTGCENFCTFYIEVLPLPTANNRHIQLCEDDGQQGVVAGVDLTTYESSISMDPSVTFSWFHDADMTIPVDQPGNVDIANGDRFFVEVTSEGDCTSVATVTFEVTENIVLQTLSAWLCADDDEALVASGIDLTSYQSQVFPDGSVGTVFRWFSASGEGEWTSIADPMQQIIRDGDVFLVEVEEGNCTASTQLSFEVRPLPAPPMATDQEECAETPLQLLLATASVPDGYTVVWYTTAVDGELVGDPVQNTTGTIIHYAETFDGYCASHTRTPVSLTIHELPTIDMGGPYVVDYGDPITLNPTASGEPDLIYAWSPPELFDADQLNLETPTTLPLIRNAEVALTVTDGNTCSTTAVVTIDVDGAPLSVTLVATPDEVCAGGEVMLHAVATGGSGSYEYSWSDDNGALGYNQESFSLVPASSATYTVVVSDGHESFQAEASVVVRPLPEATAESNSPVYSGNSIALTGLPNGMESYTWSGPGGFFSDEQHVVIEHANPDMSGTYLLEVTDMFGCMGHDQVEVLVEDQLFTLQLFASPQEGATALSGAGEYPEGTIVDIVANIAPGWIFSHWSGEDASLFGNVQHNTTTFVMPGSVVALTAHFLKRFSFTYEIEGSGSIIVPGDGPYGPPSGSFTAIQGNNLVVVFDPSPGYQVIDIEIDGESIGAVAEYAFVDIQQPAHIKVVFAQRVTLTYQAGPNGSIAGEAMQQLVVGEDGTPVEAVADEGYRFIQWSDGVSDNPRQDSNVQGNIDVTAEFERIQYQITVVIDGMGSVTVDGETMIRPPGDEWAVYHGSDVHLSFEADEHHEIVAVVVDDAPPGVIDTYRLENIRSDHHVTLIVQRIVYRFVYRAERNGRIEGESEQQVYAGDDGACVEAVPDPGYRFTGWSDGSTANPRCDGNASQSLDLTASFEQILYQVVFSVNMSYAKDFDRDHDRIYLTGSMFDYAEPGSLEEQRLWPGNDHMVFVRELLLPAGRYYYKYFRNEGWDGYEWPSVPIRIVDVDRDVVVNDFFGRMDDPTSLPHHNLTLLRVYPNPVSGTLHIQSTGGEPLRWVRLIDMLGKAVYSSRIENAVYHHISVNHLPRGMYILQVETLFGWQAVKVQVVGAGH